MGGMKKVVRGKTSELGTVLPEVVSAGRSCRQQIDSQPAVHIRWSFCATSGSS